MIVRIIHVFVKKDTVDSFKTATVRNHRESLKEPGVLRFDVLQDESDETHFVLYEVYRSETATEEHKKTPHYAEWKEAVAPMMSGDRERSSFKPVAPAEHEAW